LPTANLPSNNPAARQTAAYRLITMSEGIYGDQATGRITHSLLRLSTAMRSEAWNWAEQVGLTPTQGEILVLLMQRKESLRLGEIARETALTAATTSDAVSTLETKGLVEKRRALDDGRALAVRLTSRGRTAARKALQWPGFLSGAVDILSGGEQVALYRSLVKVIRDLELKETIPLHRMCLSCSHFEPGRASARKQAVHHCNLLKIQYDDTGVRLDCSFYEEGDALQQRKAWKIFSGN